MKKLRSILVMAIMVAVTIRILWWGVEPLLPYLIVALFLVFIMGAAAEGRVACIKRRRLFRPGGGNGAPFGGWLLSVLAIH